MGPPVVAFRYVVVTPSDFAGAQVEKLWRRRDGASHREFPTPEGNSPEQMETTLWLEFEDDVSITKCSVIDDRIDNCGVFVDPVAVRNPRLG